MSRRTRTVWLRSEWAFVFQTHWSGRLCAKAFTEKLRFLVQLLTMTTATNDPLPRFCRIADEDPRLRRYLFGRHRPGTRMEAMSW
jgi:hypothetical protein